MINVIGHRKIFLGLALVLVGAGIVSMVYFGFRFGVDFTGGSLWQLKVPGTDVLELEDFFKSSLNFQVSGAAFDKSTNTYAITLNEITDAERQSSFEKIKSQFNGAEDLDFWRVTPSVSKELRNKSITAVILVMVAISLYVAFAFRKVSRPVSSWKYGVITLITLAHDVIIPAGVFAALGELVGVPVDPLVNVG